MDPKILVILVAVFIGIPLAVIAGIVWRPFQRLLMGVFCFALCYPELTNVNLLSREVYRTSTRGFEIGLLDICAISLLITLMIRPLHGKPFHWFPPLTIVYGIYILFAVLSWMMTPGDIRVPGIATQYYAKAGVSFYKNFETGLYPLFEISKLLRGGIIYLMVVNFIRTEENLKTVISGFLLIAVLVSVDALSDRYIDGQHRISATLGHPNSLGTFMAMVGTVLFGFVLFRETFFSSGTFGIATTACLVSVLLTISRGALAALVMGLWIDFSSLFHRYMNPKNFLILLVGSAGALGLFYMSADTLTNRFLGQQDAVSDIHYRDLYNEEARMMAADHPLGVGLGNFSTYSWLQYGRAVDLSGYGTPAHNVWYLTLGEIGYPGLSAFILYWVRCATIGIPFLFRRRKNIFYAAAVTCTAAILIGHIQFMLQLSYRQTSIYMLIKVMLGIVVACRYMDRETRKEERHLRVERRQLSSA